MSRSASLLGGGTDMSKPRPLLSSEPSAISRYAIAVLSVAVAIAIAGLLTVFLHTEMYLAEAQRLSQTGSFGWDVSSGEIFWSKESFRIFGYDEAPSVTIDMVLQRVHPEDRALVQRTIDRASSDGKDFDYEYRVLMPDSSVKHVHIVAHAVRNPGDQLQFIGAVMDVTAAKQAGEELHKTQTALAHVTRLTTLGELTASIAHEVNQPLAAVVTNAEACLRWLD